MESPFTAKVDSSVSEVYPNSLTVPPENIVTTASQRNVIGNGATVEELGPETQAVLLLHQDPRVVLPSVIPSEMVRAQTDEISDQPMNTTIVDSYGNQISSIMNPFTEREIDSRVMMKGAHLMEGPTTREKFNNTLVGCISNIITKCKRPMSIDEIIARVTPVISELRKMDGTRYKGNIVKAVTGALSSTGIFKRNDNGNWILREDELRAYEQRTEKKLESKGKKKKYIMMEEEEKQQKRKYAKRKDRKQSIIKILNGISEELKVENPERNSIYFQNPFINCSCYENCASLQKALGPERFRLCMQLYAYFEDSFKIATGNIKYDLQRVVNTGNPINDKRIIQLRIELDDIKRRMRELDKKLSKQPSQLAL